MPSYIQPSFAKGEIAPAAYGRVDTAMYQVALRKARNLIIHATGGASNRPGTVFIGPVKTHSVSPRLFDFQFKIDDQYVLEFGNLYMRVIRNDAHVLNASTNIIAVTQDNPVVVTANSHGFSNGDEVFITGVVGMTQLNGNRYIVASQDTNTFELTNQVTGANISGTGFDTYISAGTVASIFELVTTYATADLDNLKMVQNKDILTGTHRAYAPRDITRTDHNAWTITVNTYAPTQAAPTAVDVQQQGASGSTVHRYRVTAIRQDGDVFEESLPGLNTNTVSSAGATNTNPVVVTASGHNFVNGDEVEITGYTQMEEVNGRRFIVSEKETNTFKLEGEDGSNYTEEISGGTVRATFFEITDSNTVANTTLSIFNRVTWTASADATRYAIYRRESGRYGLIAEVSNGLFTFDDVTTKVTTAGVIHITDLTISPPNARNPFLVAGTFPGASGYHEQRQGYGGSTDNPDTTYYSQTGNRLNMSSSTPVQADDAITTQLASSQSNEIRHFVPGTDLIIFTDGSEWRVTTGDNSGFAADTLRQRPQTTWGATHDKPLVIGETILFVENGGVRIRGFGYSLEQDKYTGPDLTQIASHLLGDKAPNDATVAGWAYASVPDSRIYIVRSDGKALTLTFDRTQEVLGWTTWDTNGNFERVTSLRKSINSVEDGVYWVVQRTINGQTVRYIERSATRTLDDIRDAFFVDAGLSLDIALTISDATAANPTVVRATAHGFSDGDFVDIEKIVWQSTTDAEGTVTTPQDLNDQRFVVVNSAPNTFEVAEDRPQLVEGASQTDPVVISSTAHGFSNDDVVWISGIRGMTQINDQTFTVESVTDDTFALKNEFGAAYPAYIADGEIRLRIDGSAFAAYVSDGKARKAVTSLTGLEHLEGESVAILADGSPVPAVSLADATDDNPTTVVVNGALTLKTRASRVHIGLGYVADLETLNVEISTQGVATTQGKKDKISTVMTRFERSITPLVGPNEDRLLPMKQRDNEKMGTPTALFTGDIDVTIQSEWNSNGRLFYRQPKPVPTTWLAIVPNGMFEDL